MFQIKSYLQHQNTPDGKPRVLVEGVDYDKIITHLDIGYCQPYSSLTNKDKKIAYSTDCRPLLTVEIDGVEWTEGDVLEWQGSGDKQVDLLNFTTNDPANTIGLYYEKSRYARGLCINSIYMLKIKSIGSFFDDPVKYSKLLWNCNQEKGWEKIFELLNIK